MTDLPHSKPSSPKRLGREALRSRKHDRTRFHERERTPIALVFDGVFGNYNHGAIFRLSDAFMIERVHFCGAELKPWHKRFLKSARGTYKWVPYQVEEQIVDVIKAYSKRGYQVTAIEQCDGSVPILEAEFKSPACLVFGGELSGVSTDVIDLADQVVELPTLGMANSLNVAMSAGMVVLSAYQSYIQSKASLSEV